MEKSYSDQHRSIVQSIKKGLPSRVTFLSPYVSKKHGYGIKAVVRGKDYFFRIKEFQPLTSSDIVRLQELILSKDV